MKHLNYQKGISSIIIVVVLAVILVCVGGAYYFKQQQAKPVSKSSVVDATANWKTYTNNEGEFSIQYPPEWKVTERRGNGNSNSKGITLEGKEGSVYLDWGSGFGGMCDPNKKTLKLYNNSVLTCSDTLNKDGTENWSFSSIGELPYQKVNSIGHIVSAIANKPSSLNRAVILKIFSTIKYTGPNQTVDTSTWKTYTNKQYGFEVKYPQNYTYLDSSFGPKTDISDRDIVYFNTPANVKDSSAIVFSINKEPQTLLFQGTFVSVPQSKAGNTKLMDNWVINIAINGIPFKSDIWFIRNTLLAINFYTKQQNNNYITASLGVDINSTAKTDSEAFFEAMNNNEKVLIFNQMLYSFKFLK